MKDDLSLILQPFVDWQGAGYATMILDLHFGEGHQPRSYQTRNRFIDVALHESAHWLDRRRFEADSDQSRALARISHVGWV